MWQFASCYILYTFTSSLNGLYARMYIFASILNFRSFSICISANSFETVVIILCYQSNDILRIETFPCLLMLIEAYYHKWCRLCSIFAFILCLINLQPWKLLNKLLLTYMLRPSWTNTGTNEKGVVFETNSSVF